jgi:hypothetical protein
MLETQAELIIEYFWSKGLGSGDKEKDKAAVLEILVSQWENLIGE